MSLRKFNLSLIQQYKSEPYNKEFERSMMDTLFEQKDYDMILICLKNKFEMTQKIKHQMVLSCYKPMFEYLFLERWKPDISTMFNVIGRNNLEMVQWLVSLDPPCPCDYISMIAGIKNGNLEILDFIFDKISGNLIGCISIFYETAVKHGHFHVLPWIQSHWPGSIRSYNCDLGVEAIKIRSLPTLQWLINNGYPYQKETLRTEATNCSEILEYIETLI